MAITMRIAGLEEAIRSVAPRILNSPLGRFFGRSAITVQGGARKRAPVDRGRLRADINYEIDHSTPPLWAKVGNNLFYAPWMEYGTGTQSDAPGGSGGRHWPPAAALEPWAQRHGFPPGGGAMVARAIGLRGGLRPRRYLRDALEDSLGMIDSFLRTLASEIVEEADK